MHLKDLRRATGVERTEMRQIAEYLIKELSAYLHLELKCFQRHIVEAESCVSTVRARITQGAPFDLRIEGVVLIQLRTESPPNIDAELLAFSRGERISLQRQKGGSFLALQFRMGDGSGKWETQGWRGDGPEDWEKQQQLRTDNDDSLVETWEAGD